MVLQRIRISHHKLRRRLYGAAEGGGGGASIYLRLPPSKHGRLRKLHIARGNAVLPRNAEREEDTLKAILVPTGGRTHARCDDEPSLQQQIARDLADRGRRLRF